MKSSPSSSEGALTSLRGLALPLNRGGTANSRRSNGAPNAPPTLDTFLANLGDPGRFQVRKNILVIDCLCERDPLLFKSSYLHTLYDFLLYIDPSKMNFCRSW